jgi:predicted N-acetyltransferase YhbS
MEIIEYTQINTEKIESFKGSVYSVVDAEHYGDNMPNFYKKEITYIATEGEEIIGSITALLESGIAQIEPLLVKTELQGQGIGSKLLQHAEKELKEIRVHKIWLVTGASWKSRPFYIKNGYTERCILPNDIGNQDFVLFDKML